MNDYSLNIEHIKKEWIKECQIVNADPKCDTPGIYYRYYRTRWLGDLLVSTGHTIDYSKATVKYTRKPKNEPVRNVQDVPGT